jgi:preprotein translocase subunit SecG
MVGFLIIVHTIVSILLISLVLMQASQGGGLSGTFGGQAASSILGGQGAGNVLSKITGWLAAIFIGLAILISIMSGPNEDSSSSLVKKAAEDNPIPLEQNSTQLEEKQPVLDLE